MYIHFIITCSTGQKKTIYIHTQMNLNLRVLAQGSQMIYVYLNNIKEKFKNIIENRKIARITKCVREIA